jgi:Fe-Mn family superoxide dismutase
MTEALSGGDIRTIEKKDSLLKMSGISAKTIEEHWGLYEGYVAKWKDIESKLQNVDLSTANQIYSDIRVLKTELSFAIGGVKNHQTYFEHLGGDGTPPTGWLADAIDRQWGSYDNWKADLKATGMGGRGWAWLAFDWDTGKLGNYIGDAQNTFPIWNATQLIALDVYEHAYFIDFGKDRASYIDAFFANLDWKPVEQRVDAYRISSFG